MANSFKVIIQPVRYGDKDTIKYIIMRILGPDSNNTARDLIDTGGSLFEGLNEEAANHLASQLRKAGADVEVVPVKKDQGKKQRLFRVSLVSVGEKKLHVIKEIRKVTGLGLKESKELVDNLGIVQDGVSHEAALKTKAMLEDAGATVTLEPIGDHNQIDEFVVHGKVKLSNGEPAGKLLVRAFDRDLRSMENLGEATTQIDGKYLIKYSKEDFAKSEKLRADIVLRAYNEVGVQLHVESDRGKTIFNAEQKEEVNLQITKGEPVTPSEYERLVSMITPILDGATLSSLTDEEIEFLVHESEIEEFEEEFPAGADSIAFLSESAKRDEDTGLQTEAFYGWARKNIGIIRDGNSIKLDITSILKTEDEKLQNQLSDAIKENIVPERILKEIETILNRLRDHRVDRDLLKLHKVTGKLLDKETNNPLIGYQINTFETGYEDIVFEATVSGVDGDFELSYRSTSEGSGTDRDLLIKVLGIDGTELKRQDVPSGQNNPVVIKVSLPKEPEPVLPGQSFKLDAMNDIPEFEPPAGLFEAIDELGAKSLGDVRKLNGQGKLSGLEETFGEESVRLLAAHADLSVVTPDLETSSILIKQGYLSPITIAKTPIKKFVDTNKDVIGIKQALEIAHVARSTISYLDSSFTGLVMDLDRRETNVVFPDLDLDAIRELVPKPKCSCKCNHALSPSAYLAELLDYLTTHLDLSGSDRLTLGFLHEHFHQPFDKFPATCEFMTRKVLQVRVCVEVLRSYLAKNPPVDTSQLPAANREYVFNAYEKILEQLGTSFEEVRSSLTDDAVLSSLAKRLSVDNSILENSNLFFEKENVLEYKLEDLFGIKVTNEPLKEINEKPSFLQWQYENLSKNWLKEDQATGGDINDTPIIEPDLLGSQELIRPSVAYSLFRERQRFTKDALTQLETRSKDLAGFDDILQDAFEITREQLKEKNQSQEKGQNIADYLKEHKLSLPAFESVMNTLKTLEDGNDLQESTWKDIYAIALMAKKIAKYEVWKQEEKDASITLSPDYFVIKRRDFFELIEENPALKWRINLKSRREWVNILKGRIEQKEVLKDSLNQTIAAVETQTLPTYRDSLIKLSNAKGLSLEEKAEWLTEQLQIDARNDGCGVTTRVAQAIQTLQNLVFSIRTGQLDDSVASFASLPDTFDEDWKWIGSYSTWKAATAVYLYPENVLRPTLLTRKTPGFINLIYEIQNAQSFSPENALDASSRYQEYFEDIFQLKVVGGCWIPESSKSQILIVAKSASSSRYYWSIYNSKSENWEFSQNFWAQIPGLEKFNLNDVQENIIGVSPYKEILNGGFRKRFICVFAWAHNRETKKFDLLLIRYNVNENKWKTFNLAIPDHVAYSFSAVVVQQTEDSVPPTIVITAHKDNELFVCKLDQNLSSWSDDLDWEKPIFSQRKVTIESFSVNINLEGNFPIDNLRIPIYLQTTNDPNIVLNDDLRFFYPRVVAAFPEEFNDHKTDTLNLILHDPNEGIILAKYVHKNQGKRINITREMLIDNEAIYEVASNVEVSGFANIPGGGSLLRLKTRISDKNSKFWGYSGYNIFLKNENGRIYSTKIPNVSLTNFEENLNKNIISINGIYPENYLLYESDQLGSQCLGKIESKSLKRSLVLCPGPSQLVENFDIKDRSSFSIRFAYLFNLFKRESKRIPLSNIEYLAEAFYFVPMYMAQQFQEHGNFKAALDWYRVIYDYNKTGSYSRYVYPHEYLETNGADSGQLNRVDDWFRDPLNPHNVAQSRKNPYLRYTLMSIVGCLLEYGDEEFTRDTSESLTLARTLYITALELLDTEDLNKDVKSCRDLVIEILNDIDTDIRSEYLDLLEPVLINADFEDIKDISVDVLNIHNTTDLNHQAKLEKIENLVGEALHVDVLSFGDLKNESQTTQEKAFEFMTAHSGFARPMTVIANEVRNTIKESDWDSLGESDEHILEYLSKNKPGYVPITSFKFCIPPNPVLEALRQHGYLNLQKLRSCRNIAGLQRNVEFYAVPTSIESGLPRIGASGQLSLPGLSKQSPTPYRYNVLINRAKEFTNVAQQIEAAYLSAMQNRNAELYSQLKARQDIQLARVGVRLQDLRVRQAEEGVTLAELQQDRAEVQVDHYQHLINQGLIGLEKRAIESQVLSAGFHTAASIAYGTAGGQDLIKSIFTLGLAGNSAEKIAASFSSLASAASMAASIFNTYANYERREQEWKFARQLAKQDVRIGQQNVKLAESSVRVVGQEREIALLQTDQAEVTADFLANKDLNAELYQWMGGVLRRVYAYFLQQATSTAHLAEHQLAFERQEALPGFVQNDYWKIAQESSNSILLAGDDLSDTLGLTGSARLLQDLYRLDQYAFETKERKQQLDITFSMAQLDPFAFQQFRESGVLNFSTSMELYDRRFPGQYLRLIRRVRTSVVALVPPVQGISATLTSTGLSRVVIGGDIFQKTTIRREPETISFTSPTNATGVFELNPNSEMLMPFEGNGVDASWQFSMPKASNPIDYDSIADVLITIEYTALHNSTYKNQIQRELDPFIKTDRSFSFRQEFADAWYDLNNPELTDTPMSVNFKTLSNDFSPNIKELSISQIILYFVADKELTETLKAELIFNQNGVENGGEADPIDGMINTRRGNGSSWIPIIGKTPEGKWRLTLPDNEQIKTLFKDETIRDILFIITYSGKTPDWPE